MSDISHTATDGDAPDAVPWCSPSVALQTSELRYNLRSRLASGNSNNNNNANNANTNSSKSDNNYINKNTVNNKNIKNTNNANNNININTKNNTNINVDNFNCNNANKKRKIATVEDEFDLDAVPPTSAGARAAPQALEDLLSDSDADVESVGMEEMVPPTASTTNEVTHDEDPNLSTAAEIRDCSLSNAPNVDSVEVRPTRPSKPPPLIAESITNVVGLLEALNDVTPPDSFMLKC
ncbi:GH22497 [Drosophila grimshawi]|uniref:GH22497 n=1 Tax=Drosophila grimshawi TaxID=7222 RepID=B4K165_DROGR|nr:GH22497 [Drosophila grimshawi]